MKVGPMAVFDASRPYLWLAAVGAVDFEGPKDSFADLGELPKIEI